MSGQPVGYSAADIARQEEGSRSRVAPDLPPRNCLQLASMRGRLGTHPLPLSSPRRAQNCPLVTVQQAAGARETISKVSVQSGVKVDDTNSLLP